MTEPEPLVSLPSSVSNDTHDHPAIQSHTSDNVPLEQVPVPVPIPASVQHTQQTEADARAGVGVGAEEISAYFKLESALFTYYCQTLVVTIGRRPPVPPRPGDHQHVEGANANASGEGVGEGKGVIMLPREVLTLGTAQLDSTQPGISGGGSTPVVDVDLGQLKSVSRLHARIEYDEGEGCFVLAVLGRNGAWVDGEWYGSGRKAPLTARSRIQIATRVFYFVLPDTAPPRSPSPSSQCSRHSHFRSHSRSQSRTRSPDGSISLTRTATPRQRSPSVDIMSVASAESGGETQWVDIEPKPGSARGKPGRKAPVGKAVGKGKGKGKTREKVVDVAPLRGKAGKGKGKGKGTAVSRDPKRNQSGLEPSTSKSVPSTSKTPSKSITALKDALGHLPIPKFEAEPLQRPAITFATHCYHAIKALGGRATLAEICQWMRGQYEWFTCPEGLATNWESSVRHNLSSNKAFVAHKRKEGEKGKGFYWTFDPACEASFLERERKVRPNQSTSAQPQPLPPLLADDGTDVSIDVEADEDEVKGTGPPKRIDTSTVIDEAKRRRAEKEERRRLKAEKRERRERREKERALKAAKRLAASGGPTVVPGAPGQPHPFFFPPYGQPYGLPPFIPPVQSGGGNGDGASAAPAPGTFMVKGPDGQMVPMPMPPPYMVPGPDGQMIPMPMPPYMIGAPSMPGGGGKDGKPEGGQVLPQTFMVKGPDGQMVPAAVPPYGFPPYGYPYYLPQGPYWMPYAPTDGKTGETSGGGQDGASKGEVSSSPVVKTEDISGGLSGRDEKTVSPQPQPQSQPHAPPWMMPSMMPYSHSGMMGMPHSATPGPSPAGGDIPPAALQVTALTIAAPTPSSVETSTLAPANTSQAQSTSPATLPSPAFIPIDSVAIPSPAPALASATSTPAPAILVPISANSSTPVPPLSVSTTPPTPVPAPALVPSTPAPPTSTPKPTPLTSNPPPDLSKVSIPIVVAPLPESYVPPPGNTATPYMALHEGKLWLAPDVFGKLTEERLGELRKLGMREVINTLQADIVQYLKDKMRSGAGVRGRGRGRARGRAGGGGGTPRPPPSASPAPGTPGATTLGTPEAPPAEASSVSMSASTSNLDGSTADLGSLPSGTTVQTDHPDKLGGPAPTADGDPLVAVVAGETGSNTTAVSLGAEDVRTGLIRPREGDEEQAPESKKLRVDAIAAS